MSSNVEQIKDRLSITEVIGAYIKLEKAGKNLKAPCPFHNEKTPSFFVSPERDSYYCFGCGKKGDIFSFVQDYENIEFIEALKMLADKAGIEVKFEKGKISSEQKEKREKDKKTLEQATNFFQKELKTNQNAIKYLKDRGLDENTLESWKIGFAPDGWSNLHNYLKSLGIKDQELERVGLIKKSERKEGEYYDRFRSRIMFPISDQLGSVVGFTGRLIGNDEKQAKYLNSPDTELFNKSKILYGYDLAKGSIRKNNFSILVEGQFDVIAAHKMGYTNSVATSGTALTDQQLDMLKRLSNRLVIALDADGAGFKASERAWQMALSKGIDVKIARLPKGKDPADLSVENPEEWKSVIKNSKHIIDFFAEKIFEDGVTGRKLALAIHEMIIPYIQKLESSVEQDHFIENISNKFQIDKGVLWDEVKNSNQKTESGLGKVSEENNNSEIIGKENSLESQILGIIEWQKTLENPNLDFESLEKKLIEIIGREKHEELKRNSDIDSLVFVTEDAYVSNEENSDDNLNIEKASDELFIRLEKFILENKRGELKRELTRNIGSDKDFEEEIMKELSEITKKIEKLEK